MQELEKILVTDKLVTELLVKIVVKAGPYLKTSVPNLADYSYKTRTVK